MGLLGTTSEQTYYEGDNLGNYRYTSLTNIVNNFMIAYVGDGKLIDHVAKSDVLFHAKRGLQEFSYDVLKTVKSIEVEMGPSLSLAMPQDYVSYVKLTYIGSDGVKRIIYPTTLTINPVQNPAQDENFEYIYDDAGDVIEGDSYTEEKWKNFDTDNITGNLASEDDYYIGTDEYLSYIGGRRYGLEPEHQQINGYFTINERTGSFKFSSNLKNRLILFEYISDGLSVDYDMRIPKMAEEAIYMHIAYSILAGRRNIPEYIVNRYKKERRASLRNAKLRLSKLNLEQMAQIMRGQSKRIKN